MRIDSPPSASTSASLTSLMTCWAGLRASWTLAPDGPLADAVEHRLHDGEVDVGLEEGEADLAEDLSTSASRQRPLAAEPGEDALEPFGQRLEHEPTEATVAAGPVERLRVDQVEGGVEAGDGHERDHAQRRPPVEAASRGRALLAPGAAQRGPHRRGRAQGGERRRRSARSRGSRAAGGIVRATDDSPRRRRRRTTGSATSPSRTVPGPRAERGLGQRRGDGRRRPCPGTELAGTVGRARLRSTMRGTVGPVGHPSRGATRRSAWGQDRSRRSRRSPSTRRLSTSDDARHRGGGRSMSALPVSCGASPVRMAAPLDDVDRGWGRCHVRGEWDSS